MSWTIIIATDDADQLDELMLGAQEIGKTVLSAIPGVTISTARTVEEAKAARSKSGNNDEILLIVAAELPELADNPVAPDYPGLTMVETMLTGRDPPRCILVSPCFEHHGIVQSLLRCELLAVDGTTNYVRNAVVAAKKLGIGATPQSAAKPTRPSYGLIELQLKNDAKLSTMNLIVIGPDGVIERSGDVPLNLKQGQVNDLIKDSRKFANGLSKKLGDDEDWKKYAELWHADYKKLGKRVYDMLSATRKFSELFGRAGPNMRVRFNLEPKVYDGLWESAFKDDRFLMIGNTLARRVSGSDSFMNKLRNDDTLNILAVIADVADGAKPQGPKDLLTDSYLERHGGQLRELPYLDDEMTVLAKLDTSAVQVVPRIKVDILRGKAIIGPKGGRPADLPLHEKVKARLTDPASHYDVVHFAGHALFAPGKAAGDGRGYLVFSADPQPQAVTIAEVAGWMAKTDVQMLYLSCCRSSAAAAALECARRNIPMTIGFNFDLDDGKAVDFAACFYETLVSRRLNVCSAFREARQTLYDRHASGDPIWAAPILVAQPMDWPLHIEAALRGY